MLSHIELDIEERAAASVPLEAFADLTARLLRDEIKLPYSPPLCLAKDIKRQFGNAGFVHWFRLMRKFEPPYRKIDAGWLQDRRFDWEDLDTTLKGWCDYTIADALATARAAGVGHPSAEAILNELARQSGAKRAAIQAEIDARDAAERAEIDAEIEAEYAVYEAWLAAGEPPNDPLADDHRTRKRRIRQARIEADHRAIDEWLDEQYAANEIGDDVPSDDPRFAAYVKRSDEIAAEHKAKIAEWEARHGGLPAIRQLFMADRRIPPGTSVYAMEKLSLLFTLPDSVVRRFASLDEGAPIHSDSIPHEYHDAMRWLTKPLQWADGKSLTRDEYDPWSQPKRQSIDLTGMPMPTPPQLSIVPAEPAPDLIKTSADFVSGFTPPDYLVDKILQKQFCYSMTARTGVGKTAVAMRIGAHVVTGRSLGDIEVAKGTVLYFAGENPTDIQMRWLGLSQEMNIDPATADIHFVPGAMPMSQIADRISQEVARKALNLALVVVDTAAAYFEGEDENSNTQAVEHARRLRSLTQLPGGPCVLILCHPTKRAGDDDLIPRGGGAFLAEVDGNIALQRKDTLIGASAQGKFRGAEFAPVNFELQTVYHPILRDARGRNIPTVIARAVGENAVAAAEKKGGQDAATVLAAVGNAPGSTPTDLARAVGWAYGPKMEPNNVRVSRVLKKLLKDKLVVERLGIWRLTPAGEKELNLMDAERPATPPFPMPR